MNEVRYQCLENQRRVLLRIVLHNHNGYTSAIERPSLILYCTTSHIQNESGLIPTLCITRLEKASQSSPRSVWLLLPDLQPGRNPNATARQSRIAQPHRVSLDLCRGFRTVTVLYSLAAMPTQAQALHSVAGS